MGLNAKASLKADAAGNLLYFAPEKLTLVTDKASPLFDERVFLPVDEALVLNIMAHGIIESVVIRNNGRNDDGEPIIEVVVGRQRVKACIEANRRLRAEGKEPHRVPCVLRRGEAGDMLGVMISENEIRREDSPIIRARKLARYLATGKTEQEAAVAFGVSQSTVRNMLKVLELHPTVQKAIDGGLPVTVAKELSNLPQEAQPEALAKLQEAGAVKGTRAVEAARNVRKSGTAEAHKTLRMLSKPTIEQWRNKLRKTEGKDAQIACAVLSRLLGNERALADLPRLKAALEGAADA